MYKIIVTEQKTNGQWVKTERGWKSLDGYCEIVAGYHTDNLFYNDILIQSDGFKVVNDHVQLDPQAMGSAVAKYDNTVSFLDQLFSQQSESTGGYYDEAGDLVLAQYRDTWNEGKYRATLVMTNGQYFIEVYMKGTDEDSDDPGEFTNAFRQTFPINTPPRTIATTLASHGII